MSEVSEIQGILIKDAAARQEIENLKNKNHLNMILIGDSYCEENKEGDITKFYWETLRDNLGLTQNVNFFSAYQSGAGFGNGLFLTKLQTLENTIINKEEITDILVCGGWNDSDVTQTYGTDEMFNTGIENFKNYVKTNYPNARVTIAHISWGNPLMTNNYNIYVQMPVSISRYKEKCNKYGWRYLTGVENILHTYDSSYWQNDGNHPNQNGETLLGESLVYPFLTGSCNIYRKNDVTAVASGIASVLSNTDFFLILDGNTTTLGKSPTNTDGGVYISVGETSMNCNGATQYEIATIDKFSGYSAYTIQSIPILITGVYNGTNSTYQGFADIWLDRNKLIIRPTLFIDGVRVDNITAQHIWIPCFKMVNSTLVS